MNDITKKLQKMVKNKKTPIIITKCGSNKYPRKSNNSTSLESYISYSYNS